MPKIKHHLAVLNVKNDAVTGIERGKDLTGWVGASGFRPQ